MLDYFLETMYKGAQQRSLRNEMAEGFKNLPVSELKKIASGELKLADYDDDRWLCKFKGTPLYDDALEMETHSIELEAQRQKMDLEDNAERRAKNRSRDEIWDAQDALRLKKRMLELELRKGELQAATGQPQETSEEELEEYPEEEAEEEEEDEKSAAAYFLSKHRNEVMSKFAARGGFGLATSPGVAMLSPENAMMQSPHALASMRFEAALEKQASVLRTDAAQVADLWGRQMAHLEKEAGLGQTVLGGLQGAGRFLGAAGKGVYQAGKASGWQGAREALGRVGSLGGQMAGQFVKQNPGAAAAIGGGALGTAALGGAALGRGTA